MLRAVFMGSDSFSTPTLQMLLERGPSMTPPVETVGVVTQPDRPAGRGRRLRANPVKILTEEAGVTALTPEKLRQAAAVDAVLALQPDLIVVASFGQLLPRSIIEAPRCGCLNLHPSLLPLYRGPSPVQGAILAGERGTGSTLMLMAVKMDAGPILAQAETEMGAQETAGELLERLAPLSAALLERHLEAWIAGEIVPQPQDESRATYTSRVTKEDGRVDWSLPAVTLARRVRAFNPWPTAYTFWQGKQLRLLWATSEVGSGAPGRVLGWEGRGLVVGTGDGLLVVRELQLEGGRPLLADAFVRGHREVVGADLR